MAATNREVAENWARQTGNCENGLNIFYDGKTIYSYGKHFPISTIFGRTVLHTSRGYSSTTANHKGRALAAAASEGFRIIEVPNVKPENMEDHTENWEHIKSEAENYRSRAARARKHGPYYLERATSLDQDAEYYKSRFMTTEDQKE